MTRKTLLLLLILGSLPTLSAQEYQMFFSNQESLYEFPDGELTGLRFDSVSFDQDSIMVPFYNIKFDLYGCSTPFGNSWIGEMVVIKPNGDHLLFNSNSDTILIKTMAGWGDSWDALLAENRRVIARVEYIGFEEFLGISDSVKTIGFMVFDSINNMVDCRLNNLKIKVSRSHGMVRGVPFNFFPDLEIHSLKFQEMNELELAGFNRGGTKQGIQNLTWFEVHDFNVGDKIHVKNESSCWWTWEDTFYGSIDLKKIKKSYLERHDYADSIVYIIGREGKRYYRKNESSSVTLFQDTIREVITSNPSFDKLPDEVFFENDAAQIMTMNAGNPDIKVKPSDWGIIWNWDLNDSCWYDCCIDGCNFYSRYYKGLGGPYGGCGNFDCAGGRDITLVYYKKGAETWGTPLDLTSTGERITAPSINVYPNPASGYIIIEATGEVIERIFLFDLNGRILLREECHSGEHLVNLSPFETGIYILSIESASGNSRHKIIIE